MRHLVAPLLVVPLLVIAPVSAAHAAGTCQGLPATVESSTPGSTLTGTEGPDVILATSTATINALGGDDVICAAGGFLDAGAGNDSVTVAAGGTNGPQEAHLGSGANHYTSVGLPDEVFSGTPTQPNVDVIDTGSSYDRVTAQLPAGSSLTATAGSQGPGSMAQFVLQGDAGDTGAWTVQLPGAISRDGVPVGSYTGFTSTFVDLAQSAKVTVRGTVGPDQVFVSAGTVDVNLSAGDDVLGLGGSSSGDRVGLFGSSLRPLPIAGRITLGAGKFDQLYIDGAHKVVLDLRKGRLGKVRMSQIEDTQIRAPRVQYTGSPRDDSGTAWGCRVTMRGGPGDDYLGHMTNEYVQDLDCKPRFRLYGQGGDDELDAGPGNDVLIGGRGRDRANGHEGRDLCSAEVKPNCER